MSNMKWWIAGITGAFIIAMVGITLATCGTSWCIEGTKPVEPTATTVVTTLAPTTTIEAPPRTIRTDNKPARTTTSYKRRPPTTRKTSTCSVDNLKGCSSRFQKCIEDRLLVGVSLINEAGLTAGQAAHFIFGYCEGHTGEYHS